MPEIMTVGLGAAGAYLAKDGVQKLLGPTCDYLGKEMSQWVEKRHRNLQRIFENACKKSGTALEVPGGVSPRVLKVLIDEGSLVDNIIIAEYFGGILACSRSKAANDDMHLPYMKLITQLSSYLINVHYTLYIAVYQALRARSTTLYKLSRSTFYMSIDDFVAATRFEASYYHNTTFIPRCLTGLERHGLISEPVYGDKNYLINHLGKDSLIFPKAGLLFTPSMAGMDLFLHAHGIKHYNLDEVHMTDIKNIEGMADLYFHEADFIDAFLYNP